MFHWIIAAGFVPIQIPNVFESWLLMEWLARFQPDALVLSGGNDVGDHIQRDRTEIELLDWAGKKKIPTLGICRGMQMMAVRAGAKLVRVSGHVGTRHVMSVSGFPESVNSFHEFGIMNCPTGFEVLFRSCDGVIEAIRHKEFNWEGWMWHPERDEAVGEENTDRLRSLVSQDVVE